MPIEWTSAGVLFLAALIAGAMNAIAGGGTLAAFPAAMLSGGLPAVAASATSTVALAPGALSAAWAYRRQLTGRRNLVLAVVVPAGAGGIAGALLLEATGERHFDAIVPWLVLAATTSIALQGALARVIRRRQRDATPTHEVRRLGLLTLTVFVLSIYGGYFGAGMSMLLLAVLCAWGLDILVANAVKSAALGVLNLTASGYFLARGIASPEIALLMAAGAMLGGFSGAVLAQRVRPDRIRALVVAIGVTVSALLAYRQLVP